jgi:predicted TIM-barrel fold metal-dependent hydrolase
MFASDYPHEMATDAARWIETAPISENDRRKICYSNARHYSASPGKSTSPRDRSDPAARA